MYNNSIRSLSLSSVNHSLALSPTPLYVCSIHLLYVRRWSNGSYKPGPITGKGPSLKERVLHYLVVGDQINMSPSLSQAVALTSPCKVPSNSVKITEKKRWPLAMNITQLRTFFYRPLAHTHTQREGERD